MGTIRVYAYNPEWELRFLDERKMILGQLAAFIADIHHVGSTSIRRMPAKPIIDICVESQVYPPDSEVIRLLATVGYQDMGEFGVKGRIWFRKTTPYACNLHWCPQGGDVPASQLKFKRALSTNAVLFDEYAALKLSLTDVFPEGSLDYNKMKEPFIKRVLESAV
jgi:GrpB-like predicted nucleotidyltransferase (UPF0157 family)